MEGMGKREERIGRNEATAREINEQLEDAHGDRSPDEDIRMLCECGRETCDRLLAISIAEYEKVRSDERRFVMAREHLIPDLEHVVEESDRYVVVVKREGEAAEIAREEDPRA
jgi:hypothetical protein